MREDGEAMTSGCKPQGDRSQGIAEVVNQLRQQGDSDRKRVDHRLHRRGDREDGEA